MRDEPIAGGRAIGFFVLAHAKIIHTIHRTELRVAQKKMSV
jgi:hypothetical protein